MLNELAALSRSLISHGVRAQEWHPWIKSVKKGDAIVAELDASGNVSGVSLLPRDEVAGLRNIAPDFQNSFPCFNLDCPLLAIGDRLAWNQPSSLWESALGTTASAPLAYGAKSFRRLGRLLGDFPMSQVAPRLRGDGPKLMATTALLDRLAGSGFGDCPENFVRQLSAQLVAASRQGRVPRELAIAMLYGRPNTRESRLEPWKATLILDVADLSDFPYRVADPAVAIKWSNLLLSSESTPPEGAFICPLSGQPDSPLREKLPNPNLPVLGPTYLMSMNADIPCQTRYGRTSTGVFPVGRATAQRLNDALTAITLQDRRGKTWDSVPSPAGDRRDLLLAYLEEEPAADLGLVTLFAGDGTDPAPSATYQARTAEIFKAIKGRETPGRDLHIRLVALSQIDKGRKQVVFSGGYAVGAVYQARQAWIAGADNVPKIAVPFPAGKGEPPVYLSSRPPSPAEFMLGFKRQWLRGGQGSQPVPGIALGRVYHLMLDSEAVGEAGRMMERFVPLTAPLLAGLGSALSGGAGLSETARHEALTAVAIYGILLFKQRRHKEIYMEDRDYLLGEFLKFADLLHKLYCQHERKGALPPQLIGNAALPMAVQSPRRALEVLSARMPVYLAWAERFTGQDAGLAGWTRKQLGRIALQLKDENLDARVGASGRAELLLGYLANARAGEKEVESS